MHLPSRVRLSLLSLSVSFLSTLAAHAEQGPTDASELPVAIMPDDPAVRYVGRFDRVSKDGPRCNWSASTVALRFHGTDLNARLNEAGQDRWQIEIDGKAVTAFQLHGGEHRYRVAGGLPDGDHTVRLVKATEPFIGVTQITGFQLNQGGRILPMPAAKHRIEVIGDSISCGYGNEAASEKEHFSGKTENAYFTYGAIAARALDADYTCIAWSGRKMWPDNTMPEIYDLAIATDPASKWDFITPAPDVVLINLSTNDFGKGIPQEDGWTGAYEQFIARLRTRYPQSAIYCATSPMMGDWDAAKSRTVARTYLTRIIRELADAGDAKVRLIEFAPQDGKNGLGADWHPSIKTQELMGQILIETLRTDLRW